MEAYLFFAGEIENYKSIKKIIKDEKNIFCADGGANHLLKIDLYPKLLLGDFDSISKEAMKKFSHCKKLTFSKDKDFSDGELLIKEIYEKYEKIYIFGAFGGRVDHSYFNLHFLEVYPKCILINSNEEIYLLKKYNKIINKKGKKISFLPLDKENIIDLKGFEYNLNMKNIKRGESLTLSNTLKEDKVLIKVSKGSFLCSLEI